jgi:S-adenosylmethionine hydrolase
MPRRTPGRSADARVVALLTDFGCAGHHAGVMRGVVLGLAPEARLVDLSNGVPAGDIAHGAWTLLWSWQHFPAGTVHLAVVDPGVGTPRRALAAAAGGQFFVGPDNGLLSHALRDAGGATVVRLPLPAVAGGTSPTFHGRDLFAPAAARLSLGEPLARLGAPVTDWVRLPEPVVRRTGPRRLQGQVIAVDHWGNLVTSVTERDLAQAGIGAGATVRVGRRAIRGLSRTYADAQPGTPVALINSNGHLEVAVNGGRAEALFSSAPGGIIRISD